MTGRSEVALLRRRLDATFARASGLGADAELLSDFARYLCVLVSGFLEQSVIALVQEHVRLNSNPAVQRHIEARLKRQFTNANSQRLIDLMSTFDPAWGNELQNFLVDEYKDAVNGIIDVRNTIAHGRFIGITMTRVQDYYVRVVRVVEQVAKLCVP